VDGQIDALVCELYRLTKEEVGVKVGDSDELEKHSEQAARR
jgi:hypothetical protein